MAARMDEPHCVALRRKRTLLSRCLAPLEDDLLKALQAKRVLSENDVRSIRFKGWRLRNDTDVQVEKLLTLLLSRGRGDFDAFLSALAESSSEAYHMMADRLTQVLRDMERRVNAGSLPVAGYNAAEDNSKLEESICFEEGLNMYSKEDIKEAMAERAKIECSHNALKSDPRLVDSYSLLPRRSKPKYVLPDQNDPFQHPAFMSSVQPWLMTVPPSTLLTTCMKKGLVRNQSQVSSLQSIEKATGSASHNQALLEIIMAEDHGYSKLFNVLGEMGYAERKKQMVDLLLEFSCRTDAAPDGNADWELRYQPAVTSGQPHRMSSPDTTMTASETTAVAPAAVATTVTATSAEVRASGPLPAAAPGPAVATAISTAVSGPVPAMESGASTAPPEFAVTAEVTPEATPPSHRHDQQQIETIISTLTGAISVSSNLVAKEEFNLRMFQVLGLDLGMFTLKQLKNTTPQITDDVLRLIMQEKTNKTYMSIVAETELEVPYLSLVETVLTSAICKIADIADVRLCKADRHTSVRMVFILPVSAMLLVYNYAGVVPGFLAGLGISRVKGVGRSTSLQVWPESGDFMSIANCPVPSDVRTCVMESLATHDMLPDDESFDNCSLNYTLFKCVQVAIGNDDRLEKLVDILRAHFQELRPESYVQELRPVDAPPIRTMKSGTALLPEVPLMSRPVQVEKELKLPTSLPSESDSPVQALLQTMLTMDINTQDSELTDEELKNLFKVELESGRAFKADPDSVVHMHPDGSTKSHQSVAYQLPTSTTLAPSSSFVEPGAGHGIKEESLDAVVMSTESRQSDEYQPPTAPPLAVATSFVEPGAGHGIKEEALDAVGRVKPTKSYQSDAYHPPTATPLAVTSSFAGLGAGPQFKEHTYSGMLDDAGSSESHQHGAHQHGAHQHGAHQSPAATKLAASSSFESYAFVGQDDNYTRYTLNHTKITFRGLYLGGGGYLRECVMDGHLVPNHELKLIRTDTSGDECDLVLLFRQNKQMKFSNVKVNERLGVVLQGNRLIGSRTGPENRPGDIKIQRDDQINVQFAFYCFSDKWFSFEITK